MNYLYHFLFIIHLLYIIFPIHSADPIILVPSQSNKLSIGLIYFPGTKIEPANYIKLLLNLQSKLTANLWIAIPEFINDFPSQDQMSDLVTQSLKSFNTYGFNFTKQTPMFMAAHSLSGHVVQDYLLVNTTIPGLPVNFTGLINYGGFITRYNRISINQTNFAPVLTLGAELDGFCRLTRIAEAFYYDFYTKMSSANSYSIVIEGMNHYQFVGNGTLPDYIKWEDLKAEISDNDAADNVTTITIAFIKSSLCEHFSDCVNQRLYLSQRASQNVDLLTPILQSFKIEGFLYMFPPCYQFPHLSPPNCFLGSPWTETAQEIMGYSMNLNVSDTFQAVNKFPLKEPSILNNCSNVPSCTVKISTYTTIDYYNVYSPNSDGDNYNPVAALELRAELISRQAVIFASTGQVLKFNETDGGSICAQINQAAINLSLSMAPPKTLKRFQDIGIQLLPIDDYVPEIPDSELFWTLYPIVSKTFTAIMPLLVSHIELHMTKCSGYF